MNGRNPFDDGRPAVGGGGGGVNRPVKAAAGGQTSGGGWKGVVVGLALVAVLPVAGTLVAQWWMQRQVLAAQAKDLAALEALGESLGRTNEVLALERERVKEALSQAEQERQRLREELARAQVEVDRLHQEQQAAARSHGQMEQELRTALQSRDVTISELAGKLTVNILDRVLFATAEAEIQAEGQEVLRKVAKVLEQFPDRQIQVVGHTDNVPIRTVRFPSNWELSVARAMAAVRFLTEQAGVDPRRLAAVGEGEYRPVADNSTAEGRAQNRRIAIVVLPELPVAPAGAGPGLPAAGEGPAAGTNAPAGGGVGGVTNGPVAVPVGPPAGEGSKPSEREQPQGGVG